MTKARVSGPELEIPFPSYKQTPYDQIVSEANDMDIKLTRLEVQAAALGYENSVNVHLVSQSTSQQPVSKSINQHIIEMSQRWFLSP